MYFPAILFLVSKARGVWIGTIYVSMILALQALYAYPFLSTYPHEYLSRSYNFGRHYGHGHNFFWKFLHPVIIGTDAFNIFLLVTELGLLLYFLFGKWIDFKESFKLMGVWPLNFWPKFAPQDPFYVAEVFFTCNFISMVCARGIFFQYVLWFWFSIPFLLWSGPMKLADFTVKQLLYIFVYLDFIYTLGAYGASRYPEDILGQFILMWIMYKNVMAARIPLRKGEYLLVDDGPAEKI